jgi:hypothetical protein
VVLAFLDDILVLGKDFEGHLANLRAVLVRVREYGLKLKPKKCELLNKYFSLVSKLEEEHLPVSPLKVPYFYQQNLLTISDGNLQIRRHHLFSK